MALTTIEKNTLDEVIFSMLTAELKKIYFKKISKKVGFQVTASNLSSSVKRLEKKYSNEYIFVCRKEKTCCGNDYYLNKFFLNKAIRLYNDTLTKEAEKLYLTTDIGTAYFDFSKKCFIINGECVYSENRKDYYVNTNSDIPSYNQRANILLEAFYNNIFPSTEWLFNYCENTIYNIAKLFTTVPLEKIAKGMPKGFYNYYQSLGKQPLSANQITEFYANHNTDISEKNILLAKNAFGNDFYQRSIFLTFYPYLQTHPNFADTLKKIAVNTVKSFQDGNYTSFLKEIYNHDAYIDILFQQDFELDENRSFDYNLNLIKILADEKKNKILNTQLQKLNFINGISENGFTVVVPQSQNEKQDEGKQQNNCVGYFYDNSIIEGQNYIYFVRKNDNLQKSYITCRYNVERKKTIEYRASNNRSVEDKEAIKFIKMIDVIIRDHKDELTTDE